MREKIAFLQLVELVAKKASTTNRMSELFLQELFAVITQSLSEGQSVKLKGLGTFNVKNDTEGVEVTFIPDSLLSETVNAPFAQFKPVELCDEVTDKQLAQIDASVDTKPAASVENVELSETIEPAEDSHPVEVEQEPKAEFVEEPLQRGQVLPREVTKEPANFPAKPSNKIKWLAIAAVLAAIALVAGIATHYSRKGSTATVAKTDTIAPLPSAATPIINDTLRNNNRLFDMAKRHYGDQAFWVYIALENQEKYPNYHKIPYGALLVIPPADKYGINSDSKQSLRRAYAEAIKLRNELKALEVNDNEEKGPIDNKELKAIEKMKNTNGKSSSKHTSRHHKRTYKHHRHHR